MSNIKGLIDEAAKLEQYGMQVGRSYQGFDELPHADQEHTNALDRSYVIMMAVKDHLTEMNGGLAPDEWGTTATELSLWADVLGESMLNLMGGGLDICI